MEFILELTWADVPANVSRRIGFLLRDFTAVTLAGRVAPTSRLAAEYAATQHAGDAATVLFDGRRVATTGAAWANGVLANALDFDDGHRLVKGHPGANIIPSALAIAEAVGATLDDLLAAITVGYEIAVRAGIDLHARSREYHASGAWGAVGAAAAGARLMHIDSVRARHALGLAEYHAPIAPTMRSVAHPAMTKDACGWGAFVGTSAVLLAAEGFTSVSSYFVDLADEASSDLGKRWHVSDLYVKKFPCCRWSHPAIEAALRLRDLSEIDSHQIARVKVRTFAAAAALSRRRPRTTEEAQYSLVWPLAIALAHADFGVEHILATAFEDAHACELTERIEVEVDPVFESAFPDVRLAQVVVETIDGHSHLSAVTEAPGEPDDACWANIVDAKFRRFAAALPPLLDELLRFSSDEPPSQLVPRD
jgi:2-methylcitrate dehydratase PrpD